MVCGQADGRIVLRDPRSLRAEQTITAHTNGLSALEVQGNCLLSIGYTIRFVVLHSCPLLLHTLIDVYCKLQTRGASCRPSGQSIRCTSPPAAPTGRLPIDSSIRQASSSQQLYALHRIRTRALSACRSFEPRFYRVLYNRDKFVSHCHDHRTYGSRPCFCGCRWHR